MGNRRIFFYGKAYDPELGQVILGRFYSYQSLIDFYLTGRCYSEGYADLAGFAHLWNKYLIYMDTEAARKRVWEILGRVAHLLGDMGVPAHVHNDLHPPIVEGGTDSYEDAMSASYAQQWTATDALNAGGLLNVVGKHGAIRYLFYTANQISDHFPSNDANGDNNYVGYYGSDAYTELQTVMHGLGAPPTSIDVNQIASSAFVTAIRCIAGLLHWFAVKAGIINTLYVPQYYPTIEQALANATSGQTIIVSGSQTLSSNLYVPTGVTLTFTSGSSLNFNGHYIVSTGGTINDQSGGTLVCTYLKQSGFMKGLFPSVQPAINYASSGQTIELQPRAYNESPSFTSKSNITLTGQGQGSTTLNGGIAVTNSSYINVSNLTMSGALSLNNNDHAYFTNATVTGTALATDYGGTMNELYRVSASNIGASFGLTAYGGTGDLIESSISNGDCAVYLTNNASYNIGTNNTFCSNGLDIDAENGAYAYAISNIYSAPLPSTIGGNVFVTGQNGVCSQPKILLANNNTVQNVPSGLKALDEQYLALLRKIREDKLANKYDAGNYVHDFQQLINGYKSLVKLGDPLSPSPGDKSIIKAALSKLSHLYKKMGDYNGFKAYITESLAADTFKSVESYLKRYLIWDYVDGKQAENGLRIADEVLSSSDAEEDLMAEMLYEKGLIYKYYENNIEKANGMFASLMDKYPSSPLIAFAKIEMSTSPGYASKNVAVGRSQPLEPIELSNYPNPFNPTTTISYELPSNSFVTLKVYDVLGREVKTLVNGYQEAGSHSVQFNGENLPSGVYLYRLTAPGVVQVKKMLMMK